MSVGELLDATFSLYRRNFLLIAAISAVVQVPFALIQFVLYETTGFLAAENAFGRISTTERGLTSAQLHALGTVVTIDSILLLLGILVVLPLAEAATTRAVSDRYLDRVATVGSSYAAAVRRMVPIIVQSLILIALFAVVFAVVAGVFVAFAASAGSAGGVIGIPILIAALAFIVVVYVRTSLAPPAIVLEHLSGWRGLRRSWNLVRGLSWRVLGIRILLGIITGIIGAVLGGLLALAGAGLDAHGQLVLRQVISAFTGVFIGPITYIAVTLLYYDTRIRKEGFDIEMLAQSL
jgi:hypothetical protein